VNMGLPCRIARLDGKHTFHRTCGGARARSMTAIGIRMLSDEHLNTMQVEQVDWSV
jgi:hypothetical protein